MTKINQYNEKGQRHGYWEHYYTNGNLMYTGHFDNGDKIGLWGWYYVDGELREQIFYS
jgi:antitoxin component YwqK of YwqJK toxin-antitoxin module